MKLKFLVIPMFLLLIISCSSIKVTCDYDGAVDFTKFKTYSYYGWAEESDKVINNLDKERIEKAFAQEFGLRNMNYVKEGGDLMVTLFIVVEQKKEVTANTTGGYYGGYYGYGPGYGWGPSYSSTTVSEYEYNVGTLVCDVFDASNKKLIWEGIATKTIDENPKNREKTIPYGVKKIMSKYPVQPVQAK